jgi:LysR family nitrogen assimilation transcriptional regulator
LGTVRGWQAVLLLLGAIGVLFSGIFLSVREPQRRERLAVPRASVAALGAALPMAAAPLLANPWWVVAVLYVGMTFLVIPSALAPAMLQSVCPNELRGQVFSVYLLVMSTFGYALGPLSVAWITDHVLHSENRLHVSLALVAASVSRPPPAVSPPHVAGTASSLRATRIPGVVHKAMPGIHVDLRQLRYFKAIADARSFVRAADHLHVAQPALSRSIAKLEEQLGRLLFIRHSGGISLTDSGVLLYQHAEHVLKGMQRLTDEMAADNQVPRGLVSMGAPPSMQSTLTAPVAARFIKAFPYAFLNVIQDTSARLREGVAAGHLDVIVVSSMAPSGGLHYSPLFTESLCLIYAATSPLHMKTHARLEDMLGIPLILCGYPDTLRLYLNQAFADSEQKPTVRCEVNSAGLVADLVAHGAGVGIAPYGSIPQQNQRGLVVIPILGLESSWMIATSFERIGSTAVQQLSTMIVDHVRHAVASGAWPTARFDGPATSDPDLQRTQLPAWQEPVEGVVATLSL